MNNYQIKYKKERIWTNDHILTLLKLLIIVEINNQKSSISENIIEKLNFSIEWDLDEICANIDESLLMTYFNKIKDNLTLNSKYYSTNDFAHKLYPLINQNFNKKESSKLLTNLSRNKGEEISKVISKILNLSQGKLMFETVEIPSVNELIGEWKSINIPDYGLNFNMTDLSPSYDEIKIIIGVNDDINIIIPARDYTNPKISEFTLITGKCKTDEGHLLISKNDWIKKIPILKFDSKTVELHLFKTNITLKRTTR